MLAGFRLCVNVTLAPQQRVNVGACVQGVTVHPFWEHMLWEVSRKLMGLPVVAGESHILVGLSALANMR